MKLHIVTPLSVVVEEDGVRALRAEDASGSFGVMPGHAPFLTSLLSSAVDWEGSDGQRHYCAVRRGVLTADGQGVCIATREAILGHDLESLDQTVLARYRADREAARTQRTDAARLELAAIRQIMRRLRPQRGEA